MRTQPRWLWPATLVIGLALFVMALTLPDEPLRVLIREDGVIEYLGAAAFGVAAVLFTMSWFRSSAEHSTPPGLRRRRLRSGSPWFLLLALALFFAMGEEISWGQRLLGFDTPALLDSNVQEETTLHNLPAFDPTNTSSLFHMNRLFTYFWFGFAIVVPIASFTRRLGSIVEWTRLPIVPLSFGLQFLLMYLLSKSYGLFGIDGSSFEGDLVEVRETQHALIFAAIALHFHHSGAAAGAKRDPCRAVAPDAR